MRRFLLLTLCLATALLAGCGNKGPLYRPNDPHPPVYVPPPAPASTPALPASASSAAAPAATH